MKEAKEFAESIAAIFIETSARNAVNVEELFQKISRYLLPCIYVVCACIMVKSWDTGGTSVHKSTQKHSQVKVSVKDDVLVSH